MEIEALLKTMMDELKDAQMMYDYACGSKKYGHDDLMTFLYHSRRTTFKNV